MTKLNLSHNRLTALPPGIYSMLELHSLLASNNQVEELDERICDLNMLVNLDLAHNKLKVSTTITTIELGGGVNIDRSKLS